MCTSGRAMQVLLNYGASVTVTDVQGNTALHWAAMAGSLNCVHLLLEQGIYLNKKNGMGVTPLMCAVSHGHIDIVRYLILQGASTTPELNSYNESALTFASQMVCDSTFFLFHTWLSNTKSPLPADIHCVTYF